MCWEYGVRRLLRPQPPGSLLPPIRDATHGKQVEGVFSLLKRSYQGDHVEVTPSPPTGSGYDVTEDDGIENGGKIKHPSSSIQVDLFLKNLSALSNHVL